jgi:hypothetical protein
MFHSSTQCSNWLFKDSNELNEMRTKANYEHTHNNRAKQVSGMNSMQAINNPNGLFAVSVLNEVRLFDCG